MDMGWGILAFMSIHGLLLFDLLGIIYVVVYGIITYFLITTFYAHETVQTIDSHGIFKVVGFLIATGGVFVVAYSYFLLNSVIPRSTFLLFSIIFFVTIIPTALLFTHIGNKLQLVRSSEGLNKSKEIATAYRVEKYSLRVFIFLIILGIYLRVTFFVLPSLANLMYSTLLLGDIGVTGSLIFILWLLFHFERKALESKVSELTRQP